MRLHRFRIERFRGLRDADLAFPSPTVDYGTTDLRFLVGRNGSGKSTALEALALVFSHLAADAHPGFAFELEYELRGARVRLTTRRDDPAASDGLIAAYRRRSPDDEEELVEPGTSRQELVPERVVGYSTGPTTGMGDALFDAVERQAEEIRAGDADEEEAALSDEVAERLRERFLDAPQTLFLGAETGTLTILAALLAPGGIARDVLDQVGLDRTRPLLAFSIVLKHRWQDDLPPHHRDTAWRLLDAATMYSAPEPDEDLDPEPDAIAAFDVTQELVDDVLPERVGTSLQLLDLLVSWQRRGILRDIRLVLRKPTVLEPITDQDISDGELFYLSRYGLLRLIAQTRESLLLLDEPETHFNDNWKIDLVQGVIDAMNSPSDVARRPSAHEVVIATHSDLTLTDADPKLIQLFVAGPDGIQILPAPVGTFGAAPGDLGQLLFGLPAPVGRFSEAVLREALDSGTSARLRDLVDIMGPGYLRLALQIRIAEQEGRV